MLEAGSRRSAPTPGEEANGHAKTPAALVKVEKDVGEAKAACFHHEPGKKAPLPRPTGGS